MPIHMIKLVVGVDDLDHFAEMQAHHIVDYDGQPANMVYTRFKPKREQEILKSGGSIYRVIKNRIQCRQEIIGFEMIETKDKGTQCTIMVKPQIIQTVSQAHRPFQGWRYFDEATAPKDRGPYNGVASDDPIPEDMEDALRDAGIL